MIYLFEIKVTNAINIIKFKAIRKIYSNEACSKFSSLNNKILTKLISKVINKFLLFFVKYFFILDSIWFAETRRKVLLYFF